jgi:hypothetical protein
MANPHRYFRDVNRSQRGGTSTYRVVSGSPLQDEGVDTNYYPYGEVSVFHSPEKFVPNVGNSDARGMEARSQYKSLADALGVHPDLIKRVKLENNGDSMVSPSYQKSPKHLSPLHIEHLIRQNKDLPDRQTGNIIPASVSNPDFHTDVQLLSNDPRFNPETLFDLQPETLKVENAFTDPKMNKSVTTMIQLAQNDFPDAQLIPSSNLSPHSSKLVKNALSKGLIKPNAINSTGEITNDADFDEMVTYPSHDSFRHTLGLSEVPQHESVQAYEQIKDVLRGRPRQVRNNQPVTPKGLSDQFTPVSVTKRSATLPTLPGMEGF